MKIIVGSKHRNLIASVRLKNALSSKNLYFVFILIFFLQQISWNYFLPTQKDNSNFQVKSDVCRVCSGPIESDSTIQLYPDDDLLEMYKERLAAQKAEKKSKKENKEEARNGDAAAESEAKIGTSAIVKKGRAIFSSSF